MTQSLSHKALPMAISDASSSLAPASSAKKPSDKTSNSPPIAPHGSASKNQLQNQGSTTRTSTSSPSSSSSQPPRGTAPAAANVATAPAKPSKQRSAWLEQPTAPSPSEENLSSPPTLNLTKPAINANDKHDNQSIVPQQRQQGAKNLPVIPVVAANSKEKEKDMKGATAMHLGKYGVFLQTDQAIALCARLGLKLMHVKKLKRVFESYDVYHTGEITRVVTLCAADEEFLMSINEEKRQLTSGIFRYSTMATGQKYMTFDDFILCVATFASMTKSELYRYVFELYDVDKSGTLNQDEFCRMSQELQSKKFSFPKNVKTAVTMLTSNGHHVASDGLIDYSDFVTIARIFPLAFFPIFNMQYNVRKTTMGLKFWSSATSRKLRFEELVHHMRKNFGNLPKMTWRQRLMSLFNKDIDLVRKMAVDQYTMENMGNPAHARMEKQKGQKHLVVDNGLATDTSTKRKSTNTNASQTTNAAIASVAVTTGYYNNRCK